MSNKQIAALMAVRAFAGTNTVSADNDFADGVAAANRHVINHIDYLITQVQAGHEVPFVVEHESRFPFQGKVTSEPQPTDRHALQAEGRHPAPCARFCEANAFQIEIRQLSAQLEQADRQRVPDGWRELCRRLYVELFYCDQQMTSGKRPKWKQGGTVRDVLAYAKAALEATAPEAPAQGGTFPADAPRNIIWNSLRPDHPVEWSNPGRAAQEGEVHYIRYDLYSDAVHAAPEAPAQGEQAAEPVRDEREPSPTAGMTLGQRILHVGGRTNAAGYVEFGSVQAVDALVRHVLRDLPDAAPAQASAVDEREPLTDEQLDRMNPYRQSKSARAIWASGFRASERHQMTCTAWRDRGALAQTGGAA